MLFLAQRSWTNLYPRPLDLLTIKIRVLQEIVPSARDNEALRLVIFYYGLCTLKGFL